MFYNILWMLAELTSQTSIPKMSKELDTCKVSDNKIFNNFLNTFMILFCVCLCLKSCALKFDLYYQFVNFQFTASSIIKSDAYNSSLALVFSLWSTLKIAHWQNTMHEGNFKQVHHYHKAENCKKWDIKSTTKMSAVCRMRMNQGAGV